MQYEVKPLMGLNRKLKTIGVAVPGSKSLTNRALLIAALGHGTTEINNIMPGDDTDDMITTLRRLGFRIDIEDEGLTAVVHGEDGNIPNREASINVGSAGTVARFIPSVLAFAGGEYYIDASKQMRKRPMWELFDALERLGVKIIYHDVDGSYPVTLTSPGIKQGTVEIDASRSSQFVSGLLIAQMISPDVEIVYGGNRERWPYIDMTQKVLLENGITDDDEEEQEENENVRDIYMVEPDMSSACYFFAMAQMLGSTVQVADTHLDSVQGDVKFLHILERMGATVTDTKEGIMVTGPQDGIYRGVKANMNAMSDQTMTLAALAVFAETPTHISGIGHIRGQESDRIQVIVQELAALGVRIGSTEDSITIYPGGLHGGVVDSHGDHRIAMAFALLGLRQPGIIINNSECVSKTFGNYFDTLDRLRDILESDI